MSDYATSELGYLCKALVHEKLTLATVKKLKDTLDCALERNFIFL
jgi:hypothetical protein